MSFPTDFDFMQIKIGDGGSPETFTVVCGAEDISINEQAQTNSLFRRDCTKPGSVPTQLIQVTGKSCTISGSGISDTAQMETLRSALGFAKNYQIDAGYWDGTDAGDVAGTFAANAVLTARNMQTSNGATTMEITLECNGMPVWTAA